MHSCETIIHKAEGGVYTLYYLALTKIPNPPGVSHLSSHPSCASCIFPAFRRFESFESFELHISRFSRESIISQQRRRENTPDYLALTGNRQRCRRNSSRRLRRRSSPRRHRPRRSLRHRQLRLFTIRRLIHPHIQNPACYKAS